jgi:hypothetical protein
MAKANQRALHEKAIKHLTALEVIIDQLKAAGPHDDDRWDALLNTKDRLSGLAQRCGSTVGLYAAICSDLDAE